MGVEIGMIRVSVAVATYNGEKYIAKQLESILDEIGEQDEIVISDDGSTDRTLAIIREFMQSDARVHLLNGPKQGVKKNFEHAIRGCVGEYIFLCDQDDIWISGKVAKVLQTFETEKCSLVIHDAVVVEEDGETVILPSFYEERGSKAGAFKNVWKNSYIGCCMAFNRELLDKILPIPNNIEMHDQWIGVINDLDGNGTIFIPDKFLYYRRHGKNASSMKHYGIAKMIRNRLVFVKELGKRRKRYAH